MSRSSGLGVLVPSVGDTNDTAGGATTSIAGLERLLIAALAEVISASVDNNGALKECQYISFSLDAGQDCSTYANHGLGSDELDKFVLNAALGVALGIGLDVSQVTDVACLIRGSAVGLVVRVDCEKGC